MADDPGLIEKVAWTATLLRHALGEPRDRAPGGVVARRDRRARAIARFAIGRVPFYRDAARERGLESGFARGADDLARLPLVDPIDLAMRPEAFRPGRPGGGGWVDSDSGGSTGEPRTIRHGRAGVGRGLAVLPRENGVIEEVVGARRWRVLELVHGDGATAVTGDAIRRRLILPSRVLPEERRVPDIDDLDRVVAEIVDFAPEVVFGYGSWVGRVFRHVAGTGVEIPAPKVVTYTADALTGAERELIEERFGAVVLSLYRSTEAGFMAFECREGRGLHVNEDLSAIRIAGPDGETRPPGEPGEVVLSNLVERETVLLNYRLGDRAEALEGPCPCGRTLPRIRLLEGRVEPEVTLGSGRRVDPLALMIVTNRLEVWRWQVVQSAPDAFVYRLMPRPGVDRAAMAAEVRRRAREVVGNATVDVEFVDRLERTKAGKVLPFVRP